VRHEHQAILKRPVIEITILILQGSKSDVYIAIKLIMIWIQVSGEGVTSFGRNRKKEWILFIKRSFVTIVFEGIIWRKDVDLIPPV
jgi:hypothetical protein